MRTTPDIDDVKELIPIPESVVTITPFLNAAHNLVETAIVAKFPDTHTDDVLFEIERWLAAHFTAIRYTRTSSESISSVTESYQHKLGLDLRCTMYGQQAIILDTTGALSRIGGKTADIGWVGTPVTEQRQIGDGNGY